MSKPIQQTSSIFNMTSDSHCHVVMQTNRQTYDTLNCTCKQMQAVNSQLDFTKLLSAHLLYLRVPEGGNVSEKVYRDRTRRELNFLNKIYSLKEIWGKTSWAHQMVSMAISNGKLFHDFNESKTVKVTELAKPKWFESLDGHHGNVNSLAVDDGHLAVHVHQQEIKIWNVRNDPYTCEAVISTPPQANDVRSVGMAKKKLYIFRERNIEIYDVDQKKIIGKFEEIGRRFFSRVFAVSEELAFVVTADRAGIEIIDLIEKKSIGELKGHAEEINSMHIDDGLLYSRCCAKVIKVWDIKTKNCLVTFENEVGEGRAICASDGEIFYSHFNGVYSLDCSSEHCVIFNELANLIEKNAEDSLQRALERFSRMPTAGRKMIYAKHYGVLKNSEPKEPADLNWAEDAFHDRDGHSSTPVQKAETIRKFTAQPSQAKGE